MYCIAYWNWSRVPGPDRAKGPGPGPLGPGAGAGTPWARGLGAPGPKMWDTRGECNHLLSGKLPTVRQATYCQAKLPTVRQATYCQASYLQSGKLPTVRHAPNRSIDIHPKGIDMHPKVSIYFGSRSSTTVGGRPSVAILVQGFLALLFVAFCLVLIHI